MKPPRLFHCRYGEHHKCPHAAVLLREDGEHQDTIICVCECHGEDAEGMERLARVWDEGYEANHYRTPANPYRRRSA